ncbi:MAG: TetR/AcrR family transcriptional regulator [Brevundimonas sp.]|uniref:TetR/AcrR family transcriptional regulator n=1 Tax=Brevundimonas sp. TaxID=1871086 RepID=UPI00391D9D75
MTGLLSRSRGRPTKDRTDGREALLGAAVDAFARHGFDGADLRGIASAAGVSPNLIRVHFGNKNGLWTACVERLAEAMTPSLAAAGRLFDDDSRPLAERLRDAVSITSAYYDAFPNVRDFVLRIASEGDDRAAIVTEKILRPAYEATRPLITAGIAAGIIRGAHPALVYVLLNSMLSQPPRFPELVARLAPDIAPSEARAQLIETVVSTLLHEPRATAARVLADRSQKDPS